MSDYAEKYRAMMRNRDRLLWHAPGAPVTREASAVSDDAAREADVSKHTAMFASVVRQLAERDAELARLQAYLADLERLFPRARAYRPAPIGLARAEPRGCPTPGACACVDPPSPTIGTRTAPSDRVAGGEP